MLEVLSSRSNLRLPTQSLSSKLDRLRVLRLSVTDRCNFRCRYCMPADGVRKYRHDELPSLETLARYVRWVHGHTPIDKVRITGGEPLVRRGIETLIAELAQISSLREVTLTTNGSLLPQLGTVLKQAGLCRVNISLDSLDPDRFALVTRGGSLDHSLAGIRAAQDVGLTPIKINTVLHRSTWKQDVPQLLDFAAANQFEIRFIELMRTGTEREWCESEFVSVREVSESLNAQICNLPRKEDDRSPARRTLINWRGALIAVGWISPRSHPFCSSCERLRMDAHGFLRRCLMDPTTFDLPNVLRTDTAAEEELFERYMCRKVAPLAMDSLTAMNRIGG